MRVRARSLTQQDNQTRERPLSYERRHDAAKDRLDRPKPVLIVLTDTSYWYFVFVFPMSENTPCLLGSFSVESITRCPKI